MAKKGLRFQTKLILAISFTVLVVTVAILAATERKVRKAYTRNFEADFSIMASGIDESRESRSQGFLELSAKLAKHSFVVEFLKQKTSPGKEAAAAFWETYRSELSLAGEETGRGGQKGRDVASRTALTRIGMIGVIDLDGVPHTLSLGAQRVKSRGILKRASREGKVEGLKSVSGIEEQEIGYFAVESKDGKTAIQEMVITPVIDPDTGKKLGLFVRGASAETSAERILDRYATQFDFGAKMESGIFLDGAFYSRLVDQDRATEITATIGDVLDRYRSATITKGGAKNEHGRVEVSIKGKPYLLLFSELNASAYLPPTWQVVLFSLGELKQDLRELRMIGSGTGVVALLLGLVMAVFLSRNLTVPIRELSEGTRHIKDGDFAKRVRIYSGDEVGELAGSFNSMAEELEQKAHYRKLLEKVSDEAVAQAMIDGTLELELGGELKTVSVLFCDIRGFTALTEHMHPTEVIEMLNDHMTTMTRVVQENSGVVDKFVGDEIMAVFGALRSEGNDAANAARCAVDMIKARKERNAELDQPIHIGIGIATGEVVAGCMGSSDRLNYTVLGARVNLAARLCGQAGEMESVIDDETLSKMGSSSGTELISDLELKGFSGVISAYRLNSMD